jgi:hypothetical protein
MKIMTEEQNKVKELRAKLANAEARLKEAKRNREKESKVDADTETYRHENYAETVGFNWNYIGVNSSSSGDNLRVELGLNQWTTPLASITLDRAEVLELAAILTKLAQ